ncbi:hypothetical protein KSF78_0005076 [Schistosoma japonicum]|nr:hypothetical protein KSF78_0005076 [Schistosoma japonicum]
MQLLTIILGIMFSYYELRYAKARPVNSSNNLHSSQKNIYNHISSWNDLFSVFYSTHISHDVPPPHHRRHALNGHCHFLHDRLIHNVCYCNSVSSIYIYVNSIHHYLHHHVCHHYISLVYRNHHLLRQSYQYNRLYLSFSEYLADSESPESLESPESPSSLSSFFPL